MRYLVILWKNVFIRLVSFCASLSVLFAVFGFSTQLSAQTVDTLWSEKWEGNWVTDWHVDAGTWEVGTPTSGPDSAFKGNNCAATVLDGDYSESVDTRLIRHTSFIVPAASENPRIRFWYWFSFNSPSDWGEVQIKTTNGEWESISNTINYLGGDAWSYGSIDLSAYADLTVQVAFRFHALNDYGGNIDVSSGWYIDDVSLITGPYVFNNPEDFESGFGDWSADEGTWEVGIPTVGPDGAHGGNNCAGTKLDGNYQESSDSRLISPPFVVPAASENPGLQFWHWFSFNSPSDWGEIQISTDGISWETISSRFTNTSSGVWTPFYISLATYAESTIRIAFRFHVLNDFGGGVDVSSGWYIDDINLPAVVNHHPLVINPIPDTTLTENDQTFTMVDDLNYVFYDPDPKDTLSYDASSDNPELITEIKNNKFKLTATNKFTGEAKVAVTAIDKKGLSVADTFKVDILTSLDNLKQQIPERFGLAQNYPNPFNPVTTIKYQLPKNTDVMLRIYNSLGQEIATLVNQSQPAGYYSVNWNAGNQASGVYFYKIEAESFRQVRKMLLIR